MLVPASSYVTMINSGAKPPVPEISAFEICARPSYQWFLRTGPIILCENLDRRILNALGILKLLMNTSVVFRPLKI